MRRAGLAAALLLVLSAGSAHGQISPGPLSRAHAKLEGSRECLKCHGADQRIPPARCLECHSALKERIEAHRGLHARAEYARCETCHVEHQGTDVDLVWWGKKGIAGFDHADTGYPLEGAHRKPECRACHQSRRIADVKRLVAGGSSADRTYLGLETRCTACHADEHRGQLPDCRTCHSFEHWKPAAGFDHARSAYPLTGRHATVACDKCHASVTEAAGKLYRKYKGLSFTQCSACHEDPHRGRLGVACASCHVTEGWAKVATARFDHDRTRYPLRGRHTTVACAQCHTGRTNTPLRFAQCTDCHADAHRGELAARADKGRCDACHDVQGWTPARFGPDEHKTSTYPLAGAHLAVACEVCHKRAAGQRTPTFRMSHARCTDCHRDPHKGEVDRQKQVGCEGCHRVDSWRQVSFDHATTRFRLEGAHAKVACRSCHMKVDVGTPQERIRFGSAPLTCDACHKDTHAGQFVVQGKTECARCHTASSWRPATLFDHNRDASYRLDGAHAKVACAGCHAVETRNGAKVMRFKPVPSGCRDCHKSGGGR